MFFEKQKSPFIRMATGAVSGSALGIFFGLIFSLVISFASRQFDVTGMMMDGPPAMGTFIGMGFGAIIGAILGGASGIKNS